MPVSLFTQWLHTIHVCKYIELRNHLDHFRETECPVIILFETKRISRIEVCFVLTMFIPAAISGITIVIQAHAVIFISFTTNPSQNALTNKRIKPIKTQFWITKFTRYVYEHVVHRSVVFFTESIYGQT